MAPKKVNKEEKRREVALACADLIYEMGLKKLTVSEAAKCAGIGKGTIYEYFENKEDIIFEIINMHIERHHNEFVESIKGIESTKEKIKHFFKFVLDDDEETQKHFNGYKEYISIVMTDDNSTMKAFNCSCNDFFQEKLNEIIQEGIDNGELIESAATLSDGLLIFEKGLAFLKMTQTDYDVQKDFDNFMNAIFKLIEKKQ